REKGDAVVRALSALTLVATAALSGRGAAEAAAPTSRANDPFVHFAIARHDLLFVESLERDFAGAFAHALAHGGVAQDLDRALGHRVHVADLHEVAALAVAHDFG